MNWGLIGTSIKWASSIALSVSGPRACAIGAWKNYLNNKAAPFILSVLPARRTQTIYGFLDATDEASPPIRYSYSPPDRVARDAIPPHQGKPDFRRGRAGRNRKRILAVSPLSAFANRRPVFAGLQHGRLG